jgi:oligogalacturonide transporter
MVKKRYTLGSKLGFALADVLGGGSFALISLLFLNFLVTVEGISPAVAGVVVMVGKLWDAFIDPFLGMISDRTRSRFGRRRVFLLAGVAPVTITFSLLWYSFGITGMAAKAVYYAVMHSLFTISFSLVQVPYNALLPDMVDDYEQRAGYSSVRIFVSNIAAAVSVMAPSLLLGPEAQRTVYSYLIMGAVFGLFYGLPLLASFFATWENPLPSGSESPPLSLKNLFKQMSLSLKNRAYRQYLGIFCFGQMATDLVSATALFWLSDILGMPNMLTIFSGVVLVVGLCTLPLNNWMAKKLGKQYPAIVCMPFRALALAVAFFMGPQSGVVMLILMCALNGIGTGAASLVPYSLLPDLPDSEEMITGSRNAGVYAGMSTFIRTSTSGIAVFLAGVTLELFGYVESAAGEAVTQTPNALLGVKTLFSLAPIVLSLLVVWLGARYTLTKRNHAQMSLAVKHRRETGAPTQNAGQIKACETVSGIPFDKMWVGKNG